MHFQAMKQCKASKKFTNNNKYFKSINNLICINKSVEKKAKINLIKFNLTQTFLFTVNAQL